MDWLLNLLWVMPALYLLSMPTLDERRRRKREERLRTGRLRFELLELQAQRGREGLEAKLVADLTQVLMNSLMRTGDMSYEDIIKALHGEVPEDIGDAPVVSPKDEWILYFWPRRRPRRRKPERRRPGMSRS
jgi:hypothetical protein